MVIAKGPKGLAEAVPCVRGVTVVLWCVVETYECAWV